MIYLIDPYGNVDTGHFWLVTRQFYEALNELGEPFTVVSPSAELFLTKQSSSDTNFCVRALKYHGQLPYVEFLLNEVVPEMLDNSDRNVMIHSWLPSITSSELKELSRRLDGSRNFIVGISTLDQKSSVKYDSSYKFLFQDIFETSNSCKILWVWHTPNMQNVEYGKVRRLPEYHPPSKSFFDVDSKKSGVTVGFFGALSAQRGLGEIFILALFNPQIHFVVKGYGYSRLRAWKLTKFEWATYDSWKKNPIVAAINASISTLTSILRFLPNIDFDPSPFATEEELDKGLMNVDYLFYGCKSPHSSGMVLKALASGLPVIWFGERGEAFRNLKSHCKELELRYEWIFIPFRLSRLLKNQKLEPKQIYTWQQFREEVAVVNKI